MNSGKPDMASSHKIRLGEKIAFGLGNMNNLLMNNILNVLLNPIYNIALGVSPALIGYASAIPRLWDAISDPLVGAWSDNFRSRWGRNLPLSARARRRSWPSITDIRRAWQLQDGLRAQHRQNRGALPITVVIPNGRDYLRVVSYYAGDC